MFTLDNTTNVTLEIFFGSIYLLFLFAVILLLCIRYLIVVVGIVSLPIGIFLHFTPCLKSYGKFIIESLGMFIFLPFLQSLIFLCASKLISISFFANFKILLMISAFGAVLGFSTFAIIFVVIKSAFSLFNSSGADKVVKVIALQ